MDTCFYSCSSSVLYHWAPVDYRATGWGSGSRRPFPKAVPLDPSLPLPSGHIKATGWKPCQAGCYLEVSADAWLLVFEDPCEIE
uniref:Uncharacterized protein n=1 Tax=Anser brachyrhynchus TaxID=132585 RepID=A0A8B9C3S3_9AVES